MFWAGRGECCRSGGGVQSSLGGSWFQIRHVRSCRLLLQTHQEKYDFKVQLFIVFIIRLKSRIRRRRSSPSSWSEIRLLKPQHPGLLKVRDDTDKQRQSVCTVCAYYPAGRYLYCKYLHCHTLTCTEEFTDSTSANKPWGKVTKYIYSSTALKYNFEVL